MARPRRCRRVCTEPDYSSFAPDGIPCGGRVTLAVEEYEVIRLIDLEKLTHEQCAKQMDISRTTVTEIYESAREKIADCIVNGRPMEISGGSYRLCDGSAVHFCRKKCRRGTGAFPESTEAREPGTAPERRPDIAEKGEHAMRIAVTFENGEVFQHFGHTEQFKVYLFDRHECGCADLRRHRHGREKCPGGRRDRSVWRRFRKCGRGGKIVPCRKSVL